MQGNLQGVDLAPALMGRGFTLVELVVGIAVIGMLAAVALPRYINLQNQARTAKLQQAMGAVSSAAKLFKAQCLADGGGCASVVMEGVPVTGVNSYPTANTAGIVAAAGLATTDYRVSGGGPAPGTAGSAPTVTMMNSACN